ncbi:hypothetical protein MD484_g3238, partial [Candolleomyces efflorescens]
MDDFDSLVNLEQSFFDEGYKDGYAHGRIHGLIEGRALGREKGFEMWEELGYYEGLAQTWKAFLSLRGTDDSSRRVLHHVNGLLDLISQFPLTNPSNTSSSGEEIDILKLLRQIRSKHKLLCASLGIRPRVHAADGGPSAPTNEGNQNQDPSRRKGKKGSVWEVNTAGPSGDMDDQDDGGEGRPEGQQLLSF